MARMCYLRWFLVFPISFQKCHATCICFDLVFHSISQIWYRFRLENLKNNLKNLKITTWNVSNLWQTFGSLKKTIASCYSISVFYLFLENVFFWKYDFQWMFSCSFALFGPPQAENFAVLLFLFTFLSVSGAISMVCERKFSKTSKKFTFFRIFQLLKNVKNFKKIYI